MFAIYHRKTHISETMQIYPPVLVLYLLLFVWVTWTSSFVRLRICRMKQIPILQRRLFTCFFKDSARVMLNIEQAIEKYPKDFAKWDAHMQQLKGSCRRVVMKKEKQPKWCNGKFRRRPSVLLMTNLSCTAGLISTP